MAVFKHAGKVMARLGLAELGTRSSWPVPCQNSFIAADLVFRAR